MSEDLDSKLPKQDLLLKILRMTTSDNDNVALNAVRRANEFLSKNGWDWDKLINAKIRIAADPFSNLQTPQSYNGSGHRAAPTPPPRPAARPPQPPPRPQAPPAPPKPAAPISNRDNAYAGWCYCCGDPVGVRAGWIFDPSTKNRSANSKWQILCHTCNTTSHPNIGSSAAVRRKTHANVTGAANLGNI